MKSVWGFDLGSSSIGWAVVKEENSKFTEILGTGVRIVPLSHDEIDGFSKGISKSKNQQRTEKRGIRRGIFRYRLRKKHLSDFLRKNSITVSPVLFNLQALELYGLRNKAVSEKISKEELARIWYHLNQRRGYKSNRKAKNEDEKDTEYVSRITGRHALIKEQNITVGQYFYQQLLKDLRYRIKQEVFPRAAYEEEFDRIWEYQKNFHPELLTRENFEECRNRIIYFQRKLKSQKHLIGECRFEKFHKGIPKSSPLFQEFRIWEDINKIEIRDAEHEVIELEDQQRIELFNFLQENEKITASQLLKKFGLTPSNQYKVNFKKDIPGNKTRVALLKVFTDAGMPPEDLLQLDITLNGNQFDKQPYMQLWHLIYSAEDNENLIKNLQKKFGLPFDVTRKIADIGYPSDYGSLSARAIRKLLPYLRQGKLYHEACAAAGYNHSQSLTKEQIQERPLLNIKDLPLLQKNSLRQPVVEKIINQFINLVKKMEEQFGTPDEIRIEMARELKQNASQRNTTFKNNNDREKLHKDIIHELTNDPVFRGKVVSKRDIERYKLWKEFDCRSPYEPNKVISLAELFNGQYDIEHIIPKARLFDDSFQNKTIAPRKLNENKGNDTAFDFMKKQSDDQFHQYLQAVKSNQNISRSKREKLLMSADLIPNDFIDRQLRETQFVTKKVKEILQQVCRNVTVTSGSVTDYLRHIWGYDRVTEFLNLPKYKEVGQTEIKKKIENNEIKEVEEIKNWTKRDDHRHHAVDALVVACTRQSYIQQLNRLNQYMGQSNGNGLKKHYIRQETPFPFKDVADTIDKILVSFKPGKKVAAISKNKITGQKTLAPRGPLHEETIYGKIRRYKKVRLNTRFNEIEQIADPEIRKCIEERLKQYQHDPKKAFKNLDKLPVIFKNKPVNTLTLFEDHYVVKYKLGPDFKPADVQYIVDEKVKQAVENRLAQFSNNPKEAFKDLENNPVWLNRDKVISIKSVRCFTNLNGLIPVHLSDDSKPVDFVKTGNNHHMCIYEAEDGSRKARIVSFWEAVERKRQGLPVIDRSDFDGMKFKYSLQQNELFIVNMPDGIDLTKVKNNKEISKYLYRVQKITIKSSGAIDIWFRHHLETKLDDSKESKYAKRFLSFQSLSNLSAIKVKLDALGNIERTGE